MDENIINKKENDVTLKLSLIFIGVVGCIVFLINVIRIADALVGIDHSLRLIADQK